MRLLVATSNQGKLKEVREILGGPGLPLELVSLTDLGLPAPPETGNTFHDNAAEKATTSARRSGLCVDALGGAPGLHSARYAPTDEARRAKLLSALKDVPVERRGAHFQAAIALSDPEGKRVFPAEGRVDGAIALEPRGSGGFGYDPLFLPAETPGRTLAELGSEEKNRLSHRGRALEQLRPTLVRLARDGTL